MNVTASPPSLSLAPNSISHAPLVVPGLNEMFQHPVVLKTPSVLPPILPVPMSHSNGYPPPEMKVESPPNVGGVVVGVPSVFDPLPVVKDDKIAVIQPIISDGKSFAQDLSFLLERRFC